jgi:hypothetical protein
MKKKSEKTIGWVIATLMLCFLVFFCIFFASPRQAQGHCELDLQDIEYMKLENASCYGEFSDNHCPMPKNIKVDCDFNAKANALDLLLYR